MTRIQWGATSWILCLLSFPAQLIAALLWPRPYSWNSNLISDLGVRGCGIFDAGTDVERYICSPAHALANGSTIANGLLLATGAVLLWNAWPKLRTGRVAMGLIVSGGILVVLVGMLPWDQYPEAHNATALIQALAQWAGMGVLVLALRGASGTRGASSLTILCLLVSIIGFALFILAIGSPGGQFMGIGASERIAFDTLTIWGAGMGLLLLRSPRWNMKTKDAVPQPIPSNEPVA